MKDWEFKIKGGGLLIENGQWRFEDFIPHQHYITFSRSGKNRFCPWLIDRGTEHWRRSLWWPCLFVKVNQKKNDKENIPVSSMSWSSRQRKQTLTMAQFKIPLFSMCFLRKGSPFPSILAWKSGATLLHLVFVTFIFPNHY